MKSASLATARVRSACLAAVRVTWMIAIVVCVLATAGGLLFGGSGRDSSPQFPGFAFSDGADPSQHLPELASFDPTAALVVGGRKAREKHRGRESGRVWEEGTRLADRRIPGEPNRSVSDRQESGGGRAPSAGSAPSSSSRPSPTRAPTVRPPTLPDAPTVSPPKVPDAPPASPPELPDPASVSPQASVSAPDLPKPAVSVNVSAPVKTPAGGDLSVSAGLS
jgi:hypothetical protein